MKDFTTYEQALALKELGFKEGCIAWFDPKTKESNVLGQENPDKWHLTFDNPEIIQRPTYSQAFRWFREKGYDVKVVKERKDLYFGFYWTGTAWIIVGEGSYEQAESACLDKLIEIVKNEKKSTHNTVS